MLAAVGVGAMFLLKGAALNESAWLSGLIPTLVGAVLMMYSSVSVPRESQ